MLDLKAKLAAAGLVSAADVAAAERKSPRGPTGPKGQERRDSSAQGQQGPSNRQQDNRQGDRQQGNRPQGNRPQGNREQDLRRADPQGRPNNQQRPPAKPARPAGLDVVALKRGGKGEAYDAIRRAVERSRLDPVRAIPGEHASAFHFTTASGQLSRLMLEPEAHAGLVDGSAGIIAFMSHHGLAHGVVPRPLAEAVFEVFPYWLRVLQNHPGAGQQEPPRPPPEPKRSEPAAADTTASTTLDTTAGTTPGTTPDTTANTTPDATASNDA